MSTNYILSIAAGHMTDTEEVWDESGNSAIAAHNNTFFKNLNKDLDYTFEIVGPENIIITPYEKIDEGLYLICLRSKKDNFKELDYDTIVNEADRIGVKFPKRIYDNSILSNNILVFIFGV